MSRPIRMTDDILKECREEFERALSLAKLANGKVSFTKSFSYPGQFKAEVAFTKKAWDKMAALIREFSQEVAWHGIAERSGNDSENIYVISDIVVYPQTVSGASVEMDTEEYAAWLMENADDERFARIRMQGHSHVNMNPTPSSVDLEHQEEILNMLGDDDFYIFMIWNKSLSSNIRIYDMKKNILFEDGDITWSREHDELDDFVAEAKKMVKGKTYGRNGMSEQPERIAKKESKKARSNASAGWKGVPEYKPKTAPVCGRYDYDDYDEYYESIYHGHMYGDFYK